LIQEIPHLSPGSTEPLDPGYACNRFGILPPLEEANPWSTNQFKVFSYAPFEDKLPW
jgi:hypothetical protein